MTSFTNPQFTPTVYTEKFQVSYFTKTIHRREESKNIN